MRSVFEKPGFRGTAASMPIRNVAHSGKLPWAGIHAGLAVTAMIRCFANLGREGNGENSWGFWNWFFYLRNSVPSITSVVYKK
jgi:hypothetical protein